MKNYNHFIAIDWAKSNMAIARMTGTSNKIDIIESKADLGELKLYLSKLKGNKIMTIEETTTSQWLYTELKSHVFKLVVCDPYRNRLLSSGRKTDKADAKKLVQLLRSGLLKEVFHSGDEFINLRKITSSYDDLVKAGVRVKNQKSALLRGLGKDSDSEMTKEDKDLKFILEGINNRIAEYEEEKKKYEELFKKLAKKHISIKHQAQIPGIGHINAVKVIARVVNPKRFPSKGDYHMYCGLLKYDLISGGRSYGKRAPRYCRQLKSVYKSAAIATIGNKNEFNAYYEYLISKIKFSEHKARHAVARRIATISYGIFKCGKGYKPKK